MGKIARILYELADGWGRRIAWAALVLFVALEIGLGSIFSLPRLTLFDLYERAFPRTLDTSPVVIVAIDDASLKAIGQWPWPRQIEASLIRKILDGKPAAVGIDLIWSEADRVSPEEWIKEAGALPPAILQALHELPSHDDILRDQLKAGPIAIGLAGIRDDRVPKDTGKLAPFRIIGADGTPPSAIADFDGALRSLPALDSAASGHGVLSVDADADGVYRRMPAVVSISGRPAPSLSLEVLRLGTGAPLFSLYRNASEARRLIVGPVDVPTEPDGSIWVDFTAHNEGRFVSAADVLDGRAPADVFDQRLVLIGMTGLAQVDQRSTPLGSMPGTEVHAQLLENIFAHLSNGSPIAHRPRWARIAEPATTLLLGLLLIVTLPHLRARWQAGLVLLPFILLAVVGFALWREARLLVDVATPAIGQALVFVALIGGEFAEADSQRRRLRRELQIHMLAEAKAEGELEAGRRIQMSLLPDPGSVGGDDRFDLGALMIPARHIGGDLYDFFKIDEDRLFFCIGDVSGKGVAAALFMALGKSLCKSMALRGENDVGTIVNGANAEISRDNPEMLFITLFAGILDMQTGALSFCNAGHDPPTLLRHGEAPYSIPSEGGPPLCVLDDFEYPTEAFTLLPGDILCLTTDGISEAMTAEGVLMGKERMEKALAALPAEATARAVTDRLHGAVDDFVAGAEASDDLTILTVRWHGPTAESGQV